MREIFFKAIVDDDGSIMDGDWFYGTVIYMANGDVHIHQKETNSSIKVNPGTLCQFTGMKSQDGLRIFEHDTVEFIDYKTKGTAIVEWNKRSHSFVLSSPSYGKNFTRLSGRGKLCITGNIHNNN